ncbi:MAG: hypothetical protein HZB99_01560 [Candidatus Harrisonbacteria bacterium]|nr:hypothetical protein [Candidatus Harrisonbacteria bacterium]
MKTHIRFWLMAALVLPYLGCTNLQIRHTTDRRKIIVEEPFQFTYDLDLGKTVSDAVRLRLGIPVDAPHPEIVLKPYTKVKGVEANVLGVQYDVWVNGMFEKRVIEIYYRSILDLNYDQSNFEATMNDVGCHETLHAYYPLRYLQEHMKLQAEEKADEIGDFDHCKMIETGDLEFCTGIVNNWLNNGGVSQQRSLARARLACEKSKQGGNTEKPKRDLLPRRIKGDIQYKCIMPH